MCAVLGHADLRHAVEIRIARAPVARAVGATALVAQRSDEVVCAAATPSAACTRFTRGSDARLCSVVATVAFRVAERTDEVVATDARAPVGARRAMLAAALGAESADEVVAAGAARAPIPVAVLRARGGGFVARHDGQATTKGLILFLGIVVKLPPRPGVWCARLLTRVQEQAGVSVVAIVVAIVVAPIVAVSRIALRAGMEASECTKGSDMV